MDRESIVTSVRFREIERQYLEDGYYSDAVNQQIETSQNLNEADQREFFKAAFNATYTEACRIQAHPRCASERVDLTSEGLGVISVSTFEFTEEDVRMFGDENSMPFIGVGASVYALDNDYMGECTIYANPDGSFRDDDNDDILRETRELLDTKETIDLVCQTLGIE